MNYIFSIFSPTQSLTRLRLLLVESIKLSDTDSLRSHLSLHTLCVCSDGSQSHSRQARPLINLIKAASTNWSEVRENSLDGRKKQTLRESLSSSCWTADHRQFVHEGKCVGRFVCCMLSVRLSIVEQDDFLVARENWNFFSLFFSYFFPISICVVFCRLGWMSVETWQED